MDTQKFLLRITANPCTTLLRQCFLFLVVSSALFICRGTLSLTSEKRLLLSLPAHRNVLELQLEEAFKKIAFCKTNEEMNKSIEEFEKFLKAPGHYKDAGSKGVEYLKA